MPTGILERELLAARQSCTAEQYEKFVDALKGSYIAKGLKGVLEMFEEDVAG